MSKHISFSLSGLCGNNLLDSLGFSSRNLTKLWKHWTCC